MKKKLLIYIAAHKESVFPNDKIYIPLHVGAKGKKDLSYVKDSTGKNISSKNPFYCELTGMYWMWKNAKCDYIGLNHYRRYFFDKFKKHSINEVLTEKQILNTLKDYDIIVPKKTKILLYKNVKDEYCKFHFEKDYILCRDVISKKYPEYLDSFDKVSERKYFYAYNMFVMSKENFDKYCEWLFDILFEVEKRTDISNYDNYNKRIYGFLGERLFNVWLLKNNLKIKEYYVYNTDDSFIKQLSIDIAKNILVR